jgi:hypothetical protein
MFETLQEQLKPELVLEFIPFRQLLLHSDGEISIP